jgi:ankyrin repeat protein
MSRICFYVTHQPLLHSLLYAGPAHAAQTEGRTALFIAAYRGHDQVVKLLLEAGADYTISFQDGTPFHIACFEGLYFVYIFAVSCLDVYVHEYWRDVRLCPCQ